LPFRSHGRPGKGSRGRRARAWSDIELRGRPCRRQQGGDIVLKRATVNLLNPVTRGSMIGIQNAPNPLDEYLFTPLVAGTAYGQVRASAVSRAHGAEGTCREGGWGFEHRGGAPRREASWRGTPDGAGAGGGGPGADPRGPRHHHRDRRGSAGSPDESRSQPAADARRARVPRPEPAPEPPHPRRARLPLHDPALLPSRPPGDRPHH